MPDTMSLKEGPSGTHLWMLLCPLLCSLVLVRGSTLISEDPQLTGATLMEDWASATVPLQPDLQTEAQAPTEAPTEALAEMQTQIITSNYTGRSIY